MVEVSGEGAGELATGRDNLVYRSMEFLFNEAGQEMPVFRKRCQNDIPLARGMGSSAAAIAGGLVAANAICTRDFTANDLLEMAATIEGHPDNVAAAVMGGMQLVIVDETDDGRRLFAVPANGCFGLALMNSSRYLAARCNCLCCKAALFSAIAPRVSVTARW